jgi:hypothetical protein
MILFWLKNKTVLNKSQLKLDFEVKDWPSVFWLLFSFLKMA